MIPQIVACAALLAPAADAAPAQDVDEPASPIEAREWIHWIGAPPANESLSGRAVLLHFFPCEKPEKAGFLGLLKFHRDYADKGLVILAVTPDSTGRVEAILKDYDLPFAIGTGTRMHERWGVKRDGYAQVLIEPGGTVFFRSDSPNGIWNGKLLKGLRGATQLGERAHLALTIPPADAEETDDDLDRRFGRVLDPLAEGELGKAVRALETARSSTSLSDAERARAVEIERAIEAHVTRILGQIETELARGEVLLARRALEALAKDLKREPLGAPAVARLAELDEDEWHLRELDAAKDYERNLEMFFRLGWEKTVERFKKLVEAHPETRAAEKATQWIERRF